MAHSTRPARALRLILPAFLLAGLSAHAWAAAPARFPIYHQIKDFAVTCDNAGDCGLDATPSDDFIAAQSGDSDAPVLRLSVGLPAGGASAPTVSLAGPEHLAARRWLLDGRPAPALAALPWEVDPETGLSLDGAAARTFLAQARNANTVSVDGHAASLAGLSASLLKVDEAQGRLGTTAAYVRPGPATASTVPDALPVPVLPAPVRPVPAALSDADVLRLTSATRKSQAKSLAATGCDEDHDPTSAVTDDAVAVDARRAFVFLVCWVGAYQSSSALFEVPRQGTGPITRVVVPDIPGQLDSHDGKPIDTFTEATYDPATGDLSHFGKGRGLADCGNSARWRYDGHRFVLAEFSELQACTGGEPGDWPQLYRTREPAAAKDAAKAIR